MPQKIIDAHCHIYPEKIADRAVQSVDAFYDHLPCPHWNGTAGELVRTGREAGISHFIVFSVATSAHQVSSINHFIARAVADSDGCMTGLGAMHLESDDFARDLAEIEELGLKGVKLHPDIQKFDADDPRAMEIYRLCEGRMPIVIHAGDHRYAYSSPEKLEHVLRTFPGLQLVCAHMGGWSIWEEAARRLAPYPNVLVDCSSSLYWLSRDTARRVIDMYGAGRVLFGTDYPFWPQKAEVDKLMQLGLSQEALEDIFWRNCARLYHLNGGEDRDER